MVVPCYNTRKKKTTTTNICYNFFNEMTLTKRGFVICHTLAKSTIDQEQVRQHKAAYNENTKW